ncbi:(E2-independent) E3 ubiquitin-conjugating enzyme FATS-like [Gadus chalcogrammus]|uniref:(E2-independent) E3 ubiquitin-conjugating enzyme FATS-like n=1 Tax=Gadus chalcogrammus TaxID=1042646 RepID=UPI0024C49AE5|nr:(E2-independent) E3 ubiquitin-conjugating enzyme FATS-like [Gadus chalcogrammus]
MLSWGNVLPQQARSIPPQPSGAPTGVPEPNGDGKEGTVHVVSRRASLTLLKPPGAGSTRSAQDILALNAAAIIANIKLQRQLKNPEDGRPAKDAAASSSLQGNEDGVVGKVEKSNPGQKLVGRPSPDPQQPDQSPSLKEALERSRPGFIARSQDRVETLRRRTQERRRRPAARPPAGAPRGGGPSGPTRSRPPPLDASLSDNLSRRRDGAVTVREEEPRSLHSPPSGPSAGERSRKEVAKREACLANRRRVELFKKRLLDQILHRNHL